ncbi:UNVERIFIED_CONTAM: hypothetical protein RMT77_007494 [Armadillidium vulgare]
MDIETKVCTNTFYNADCIDFCPVEPYQNLFVVGNYELVIKEEKMTISEDPVIIENKINENKSERLGKLYLYSWENEVLKTLQVINMPGILDVRWCSHRLNDKILLGLVNAIGKLIIFTLEDGNCLKNLCEVSVTPNLALYLDWSTLINPNNSPRITVSDSEGYFYIYLLQDMNLKLYSETKAHNYEAWITSFNCFNSNEVYTGADDCRFIGHDVRFRNTTFVSREHAAGVTSIQNSLWKDSLLFSGCYNGDLNSWDTRKMKYPVQKTNLGGGVWRLRCEPQREPLLLASTMHNGFQVIEIDSCDISNTICNYSKHESLAYGADWCKATGNNNYLVGSVSFYDKLLTLWEFAKIP